MATPGQKSRAERIKQAADDIAFRTSLAPNHDEHVRDRYFHAQCPQCVVEQEDKARREAKKAAKSI